MGRSAPLFSRPGEKEKAAWVGDAGKIDLQPWAFPHWLCSLEQVTQLPKVLIPHLENRAQDV